MHARFILIAAVTTMSGSAFAQPGTPAPQPLQNPPPATVVLASADQVKAPVATDPQPAALPKPHRIARVTTCRCGDQQAQPDEEQ